MTTPTIRFGRPVTTEGVPNRYAGTPVVPWRPTEPGIDNLGITSTDTFAIPGVGEYTVEFTGWVRVVRSMPTSSEWAAAEVYTNLIEMKMTGENDELGRITVTLNPECLSAGQIRTPFDPYADEGPSAKACRMAVGALFDDVQSIPPAGAPGQGQIYRMMPLVDVTDPDGAPVAYLTSLRFAMGGYLAPDDL
jgi:hypothetical protein